MKATEHKGASAPGQHGHGGEYLTGAAKAWPTAQAHDATMRGNTEADHHHYPHDLSNAAALWPTAKAGLPGSRKPGTGGAVLAEEAKLWQTPDAQQYHSRRQVGDDERQPMLSQQARLWATPTSDDGDNVTRNSGKIASTTRDAQRFHQGQVIAQAGQPGSPASPVLNPRFVETLQGWPIGLTSYESSETESCLWRRRMRSVLSLLGWTRYDERQVPGHDA